MTYQETIELKDKILKNEISVADAIEMYLAKTKTKSWHTKDWKERRAKIIKDECEICASKKVLTLQHKSHPRKLSDHTRETTTDLARNYVDTNPTITQDDFLVHVKNNFDYCPVKLCPNCKSRNPNERMRKKPQYLCTICRLEFDEAIHKSVEDLVAEFYSDADTPEVNDKCFVSKDKYRNVQRLSQIKYWLLREGAKGKHKDEI
ncbi:MAG: hypothetical protein FWE22_03270 [Firmicutes bacterium]|nr:hypothetical protein [Bacillota bacterium]